jgi:hypothetical protein
MGKWNHDIETRVKHQQRISAPVVVDETDLPALKQVIEDATDAWSGDVSSVSNSSGTAEVVVAYEARGADKTDISKKLDHASLKYVIKRPKTERLCDCPPGTQSCLA